MIIYLLLAVLLPLTAQAIVSPNRQLLFFIECGKYENIQETLAQDSTKKAPRPAGLGAVSNIFLVALYQEPGPIIVPHALLENILQHKALFDTFSASTAAQNLYAHFKKFTRFNTLTLIKDFQQQTAYFLKLYTTLINLVKTYPNKKELIKKICKNSAFVQATVPAPLEAEGGPAYLELWRYAICAEAPFNSYTIKKISNPAIAPTTAYLLIPNSYIKKFVSHYIPQNIQNPHILSYAEKELGLKIDHWPTVTLNDIPVTFSTTKKETVDCQKIIINSLPAIFVTHKEAPKDADYSWAFYMLGHGVYSFQALEDIKKQKKELTKAQSLKAQTVSTLLEIQQKLTQPLSATQKQQLTAKLVTIKQQNTYYQHTMSAMQKVIDENKKTATIGGLTLTEFQKLLHFFNNSIHTSFFFYSSCHSGGQHFIDPYKSLDDKPLTLNYAIASDTLVETPSTVSYPMLNLHWRYFSDELTCSDIIDETIDLSKKQLILNTIYNFSAFFAQLVDQSTAPISYKQLFSYISSFATPNDSAAIKELSNIPSIRFPGTHWFTVIDFPKRILSLTNVRVAAQATERLVVQQTSTSYKESILIYTPEIRFSISIIGDKNKFPSFISMIPGKARHTLQDINARDYTFTQVLSGFLALADLKAPKLFIIEKLACINNLAALGVAVDKQETFSNIHIFHRAKLLSTQDTLSNGVYLTTSTGKTWGAIWCSDQQDITQEKVNNLIKPNPNQSTINQLIAYFSDANERIFSTELFASLSTLPVNVLQAMLADKQKKISQEAQRTRFIALSAKLTGLAYRQK